MKLPAAVFLATIALAPAHAENPLTSAVMARYQAIKRNLIEAAEAMPEDGYGFKPTAAQRPFGEWIAHTATGNYGYCAAIKGEVPPGRTQHDSSKAELVKTIKDSFDFCDTALAGMTDQKALTPQTVRGRQLYPVAGMVNIVSSDNEHYGNLVAYLRLKGITPPSTARSKKK